MGGKRLWGTLRGLLAARPLLFRVDGPAGKIFGFTFFPGWGTIVERAGDARSRRGKIRSRQGPGPWRGKGRI